MSCTALDFVRILVTPKANHLELGGNPYRMVRY